MQGLGVKKKNWKVCNKNGNYRTQVTRVPTDLGMTVKMVTLTSTFTNIKITYVGFAHFLVQPTQKDNISGKVRLM